MTEVPNPIKATVATWAAPGIVVALFAAFVGANTFWLGGRFSAVEDRVGRVETREGDLDKRIDDRFDKLGDIFQANSVQISSRLDKLIESQTALTVQSSKTEDLVSELNAKVDKISRKLNVAYLEDAPIAQSQSELARLLSASDRAKDTTNSKMIFTLEEARKDRIKAVGGDDYTAIGAMEAMRGAASKSDASDLSVVDLRKPIEDPATRAALVDSIFGSGQWVAVTANPDSAKKAADIISKSK